jgi:hypothetical protein
MAVNILVRVVGKICAEYPSDAPSCSRAFSVPSKCNDGKRFVIAFRGTAMPGPTEGVMGFERESARDVQGVEGLGDDVHPRTGERVGERLLALGILMDES